MKTPEEMAEEHINEQAIKWVKTLPPASERCNQCACEGYVAGYQAAQPQWISVKERLPEYGDWVLLYENDSNIYRGRLIHDDFDFFASLDGAVFVVESAYITHWQPLPPEPEEEEK